MSPQVRAHVSANTGLQTRIVISLLIEALKDSSDDVRKEAAYALASTGMREAVTTALVEAMKADNVAIRFNNLVAIDYPMV
jgi:HEAT repeat protein